MRMMIEIRDCNEEEDGRDHGFVCEAKSGLVRILRLGAVKDGREGSPTEGEMINLGDIPLVEFMAEFDGCYTPGEALRVFGEALDRVLAKEGWDLRGERVKERDEDPTED